MKKSILVIALACACMLPSFKTKAQAVDKQDSLALVDFYNFTVQPSTNDFYTRWNINTNWLSDGPLSTWYGVTVTGNRVTGLNLRQNNISGNVPSSFSQLTALTILDLDSNQSLYAPRGFFNNLTALTYLDISNTEIKGLTTIIDSIKNFTALKHLALNNTSDNVDSLPVSIGYLTALEYLSIDHCTLGGTIPASIGRLKNLKYLNLSENQLIGNIPDSITQLTALSYFLAFNDSLSGSLPSAIGNMSSLTYLNLSINQLSGKLPASLGTISSLDTILLNNNNLTDTLPSTLYNLSPVLYVDLSVNNFTFASLQQLASTFLFANYARQKPIALITNGNVYSAVAGGTLSDNTYTWYKNNVVFTVKHGDSTLTVPSPGDDDYTAAVTNSVAKNVILYTLDTLHNSDSLTMVEVYNYMRSYNPPYVNYTTPLATWPGVTVVKNRVSSIIFYEATGTISPSIGKLTALRELILQGAGSNPTSSSSLTGPIPGEIGNLTKLNVLDLSNNAFTLTIPSFAADTIPASFGRLINLNKLYLNNDNLSGSVPDSLKYLIYMQVLNISQNALTGKIAFLAHMKNLQQVLLKENNLSDTIPASLGNFLLTYFDASQNNLYGNIPSSLGNDTLLTDLSLSTNSLTGSIPASLGNLQHNLLTLALSGNNLSGNIPATFGGLAGLETLYLSGNNLSGPIPAFTSATLLHFAEFDGNQLSGNSMATAFNSTVAGFNPHIQNNNFTFDGMAQFIAKYPTDLFYFPQNNVPIYQNGATVYVKVGEALANDTFRLFKNGQLIAAHTSDSSFNISGNGNYNITATCKVVKNLTLYSDTIQITSLPVTLLSFTAARFKADVQLNWQTTQEVNAENYIVERSINGFNFTSIGSVNATGNSTITQAYNFVDYNTAAINSNTLYYRLKIVDKDGSFSYSKIITLQNDDPVEAFIVYPNPVQTSCVVQFTAAAPEKYTIALISTDGKVLKSISVAATAGSNRVTINVQDLPGAAYLINIAGGKDNKTFKIVKQ